jgi:hypothetical protein
MFSKAMNRDEWKAWLVREQPAPTIQTIRSSTHTGRPADDEKFLIDLEKQLGFPIRPQTIGRPRVAERGNVR